MNASHKSKKKEAFNSVTVHAVTSLVQYAAGSFVTQSGIYIAQHSCSRPEEEVIVIRGSRFPACPECIDGGGYLLKLAAPRPEEDPDFRTSKVA